jgi:hypothetical protein
MVNPAFDAWLAEQSGEVRTAILAKWEALQTDRAISSGHPRADYARRALLLTFARTEHGYP